MKTSAEAVVIGGGFIGCPMAYYLAKEMQDVVLVERRGVAAEASGANYGMVWQQARQAGYDLNCAKRSIELYPVLIKDVFDIDIEYEEKGGMTFFYSEMQLEAAKQYVEYKRSLGVPARLLDGEETRQLEPALSKEVAGSIFCAEEAQLNPFYTLKAFTRAAIKEGAKFYTDTEVTGIKVDNGAVAGVVTNRGEIKTKIVINAAGGWASQIGKMAGVDVPIYPRRLQSLVTEQLPRVLNRTIQGSRDVHTPEDAVRAFQYDFDATGGQGSIYQEPSPEEWVDTSLLYAKPTINGNVVLGVAIDFAGYDKRTNYEALAIIAAMARRAIPRLKNVNLIRSWSNFDPWTQDGVPIVEESGVKGFIVCAGHGTAISHGPATGENIASLLTTGTTTIDLPRKRLRPPVGQ